MVYKEFPYEHDEDSHCQQCATLLEHSQRCDDEEMMIPNEFMCYMEEEPTTQNLYFYGSKCTYGTGERIILVSPSNEVIPMAYKLGFECINNMVEYEDLILGLKVALVLKIKDLEIYGDLQLVVNQVNDTYNTKDEKLKPYKIMVAQWLVECDRYSIQNIPRNNNMYVDGMVSVASLTLI